MKFLILALSVVSLRADTDATCLAGVATDGTVETDENCTARVASTNNETTCQEDGTTNVCQWAVAVCDEAAVCTTNTATNGVCAVANVTNGESCDDSDAGTENDVCTDGECAGTVPAPTYGTDATCLAGSDTDGTALSDADCTARGLTQALCDEDTTGLVCAYTEAVCTDTTNACTESLAADGVCAAPTDVADATVCDDGDDTTENDVCASGVCAGTAIVTTTPAPAPTSSDATCLAGSDTDNTAETDENCTARGITDAATCDEEGTGLVCAYTEAVCVDDGNDCTTASTATDGVCSAVEDVADGTDCDDANDDTTNDVCASGVCVGGDTTPTNNTGSEAGTPSPSGDEQTSSASHAQVFAALAASAFLLL